jgi:hypothetical protein
LRSSRTTPGKRGPHVHHALGIEPHLSRRIDGDLDRSRARLAADDARVLDRLGRQLDASFGLGEAPLVTARVPRQRQCHVERVRLRDLARAVEVVAVDAEAHLCRAGHPGVREFASRLSLDGRMACRWSSNR